TVLLKTIFGLFEKSAGEVEFDGMVIHPDPVKMVEAGISFVGQGKRIFPSMTIEDNLKMGAYSRRDANVAADLDLIFEYFPALKEKNKQEAGFLSGGQQQMLAIGRALMLKPRLMLLDEPSLGLSPILVAEIAEIIVRLNEEQGVTLLLVEQNAKMALEIGD
ncbi:MAG: ABC transporter ATP-binding protein, partial [Pseudomonadales bacterium]